MIAEQNEAPVVLVWERLDATRLQELMAACHARAAFSYWLSESVAEMEFREYDPALDATSMNEGRAFGQNGQLHWRRESWRDEQGQRQKGWRAVFTGDRKNGPAVPAPNHSLDLDGYQAKVVSVRLWGERSGSQSGWLEPRIPRLLEYPILQAPRRLAMEVVEYRKDGRVAFVQYRGLAPWSGGS